MLATDLALFCLTLEYCRVTFEIKETRRHKVVTSEDMDQQTSLNEVIHKSVKGKLFGVTSAECTHSECKQVCVRLI